MNSIPSSTFKFLKELEKNNNREWFTTNKRTYEKEHLNVISFADNLLNQMKSMDEISTLSGKKSLMRIYRDVRFSKDKSPYKARFAGSFSRVKPQLRGGYFFSFAPGETIVGGGFYGPSSDDLKLIRAQIAQDDAPLRNVIESKAFKAVFGGIMGEQVKTAPKGYDKDHPSIDLLKYKSLYAFKTFTDTEVHSDDFMKEVVAVFVAIRPFFDVMTDYLTTDLNGISLVD